jgi:hypothetical protein
MNDSFPPIAAEGSRKFLGVSKIWLKICGAFGRWNNAETLVSQDTID